MSRDQYTLTDPTKLYADIDTKAQSQEGPGLDADLKEQADHGEQSYRGTGRLTDRKALITGVDSASEPPWFPPAAALLRVSSPVSAGCVRRSTTRRPSRCRR